jgi:NMD protein affecting ribosome stability and mRNA decay
MTFDIKSIKNASKIGAEDLVKEMILVSQKDDEVQVMDEKNYEIKIIRKPKPVSFDSKTIKVIKIEDKLFLLPVV